LPPRGGGNFVSPQNLFFFCGLKPHTKFHNPKTNPSGRKVANAEEREKDNSGHLEIRGWATGFEISCFGYYMQETRMDHSTILQVEWTVDKLCHPLMSKR
jgi:hypothetical protein